MANYRINVEALNGETLDQEYINGIECNGFVVMADKDHSTSVYIHKLSLIDIAKMIAKCDEIKNAAKLAEIILSFNTASVKKAEEDFMSHMMGMGSLFED